MVSEGTLRTYTFNLPLVLVYLGVNAPMSWNSILQLLICSVICLLALMLRWCGTLYLSTVTVDRLSPGLLLKVIKNLIYLLLHT